MKRPTKGGPKLSSELDDIGPVHLMVPPGGSKTKRGRKNRKMNEKEILKWFTAENSEDREQYVQYDTPTQRPYENIIHMSGKDRTSFENRFHTPKTASQEYYAGLLKNKHKKIVVANGPAGTGKTLFATEYGVKYFMANVYEKLIFTRPSVSVDEDLGYLPGTLEDKMAPWVRPIYDILYNFFTPKEVTQMIEDHIIEIAPLGYMRGRTFQNAWIVADEMQNSSINQMKMLMTRLGENSRLVITGDLDQHDKPNEINGLEDFLDRFKGNRSDSISSFEFEKEDIQREQVVREVLEIYGGDPPYQDSTESNSSSNSIDEYASVITRLTDM
jgi:phosphate starvation-inducible protein PhoH and related proteins